MPGFGTRQQFLNLAAFFEGALVFLAFGLGWLAEIDPLALLTVSAKACGWGIGGGVLLFGLLLLGDRLPVRGLKRIREFLVQMLGRPLSDCRWHELILLAALVGFSEEMLFRGLIQPWIERAGGYTTGLLASNVLFGLAHFVTPLYGLLAGLTGVYFGWLLDAGGSRNVLIPMLAHAVYDYCAFHWVIRSYRAGRETDDGDPCADSGQNGE